MVNLILGQVLGSVIGRSMQRRGGLGGGLGGALLGGMAARSVGRLRGRNLLLLALLPYVMRWVQNNGGLGGLVQRARNRGYGRHADSWVSTAGNEDLAPTDVDEIVDREELGRVSQQLNLQPEEVRQGFAEILPAVVDRLTPDGQLRPEADDVLADSIPLAEEEVRRLRREGSTA
jgi:uncharacterized protein YidB (DUF937 family)